MRGEGGSPGRDKGWHATPQVSLSNKTTESLKGKLLVPTQGEEPGAEEKKKRVKTRGQFC